MTSRAIVAIAIAAACSSPTEPSPRHGPLGSGAAAAAPSDARVLRTYMREHFAAASRLQRSIAHGRLDDARQRARWLLDQDEDVLDGWQPFVDELRAAARDVAGAEGLAAARAPTARLGQACSHCHLARAAVVSFAWEPALDDDPALEVQRKRHQWAAARLWEGLIAPSDEMWREATEVLSAVKLDSVLATGATPRGDVAASAAKLRELARRAASLTGQDERAGVYGDLLATCAGCHQLIHTRAAH